MEKEETEAANAPAAPVAVAAPKKHHV